MAKKSERRYGTCQNPECMNYGMSEAIPEDGNCPVCHTPMKPEEDSNDGGDIDLDNIDDIPFEEKKKAKGLDPKIIAIIAAVVLVLAGSVFGISKCTSCSDKPRKLPGGDKLVKDLAVANAVLSIKEGETAALGLKVSPANYEEEITKESSTPDIASVNGDSIKAHKAGKAVITIKTAMSGKTATIDVTVIAKPKPVDNGEESKSGDGGDDGEDGGNGWGKVNLGYGIYEGYRKNDKPHGHGTIRYTTPHQIVSWKDFTASPGDTFEGEFRDGRITGMGYWKHDGNVTAIQ